MSRRLAFDGQQAWTASADKGFGGESHGNLSIGVAGQYSSASAVENCAELQMWVVEKFMSPACVLPLSRKAVFDLIRRLHLLMRGRRVPDKNWSVASIAEKGELVLSPTSPDGPGCAQLRMWMAYETKEPCYVITLSGGETYDFISILLMALQQHEE